MLHVLPIFGFISESPRNVPKYRDRKGCHTTPDTPTSSLTHDLMYNYYDITDVAFIPRFRPPCTSLPTSVLALLGGEPIYFPSRSMLLSLELAGRFLGGPSLLLGEYIIFCVELNDQENRSLLACFVFR
jgi:hypothetical protein